MYISRSMRLFALIVICLAGCANQQYQTVQTGPDTVYSSGNDPNIVKSNAYKACRDINDKYTDYSVVSADKTSITVRCEKNFLTRTGEVIDDMRQRVNEWRKSGDTDK